MSHSTRARRIEERRLAKIVSGKDSMRGNEPPPAKRFHSREIMRQAGKFGMIGVRAARKICGFRHATPSKY